MYWFVGCYVVRLMRASVSVCDDFAYILVSSRLRAGFGLLLHVLHCCAGYLRLLFGCGVACLGVFVLLFDAIALCWVLHTVSFVALTIIVCWT